MLRRLIVCVGLLLLGGDLAAAEAAASPPPRRWRVGVEAEASPFTFADEQGRAAGFAVELLQAVAAERRLELEFIVLPWQEVLRQFRAGELDIICNIVDTPERKNFVAFSATTALLHGALFVRADLPPVREYADINDLRIALPRDSRAHEFLKRSAWRVEYVFVSSLTDCLTALHEGRADAVFATDLVARDIMRRRGFKNIAQSPLAFPTLDYREHFGVAPSNPELLAELNEGLLAVERNGHYRRLYERWVGSLEPRTLGWRDLRPYTVPLVVILALILLAFAWQRRILLRLAAQAEALRLSEERLSLVLEGSQDGFWDWDPVTNRVLRSPRWYTMIGYDPAEGPTTHEGFLDLLHPEDRKLVESNERQMWRDHDHRALEVRLRAKNGEWKWILDRGKVVSRDPRTGHPTRITGTHTDITPRKQAELEAEQLQRRMQETQRLESLGVLAGGIAHDFNNLLTVILGNASLVELDRGPQASARLEKISAAANRAAELCRQLLAYAGKGALSLEPLSLNAVVGDALQLFRLSTKRTVEVQTTLGSDLPRVEADPVQLEQVVMNILLNARDALPEQHGRISITTRRVDLGPGDLPPHAVPSADLAAGEYVCLTITDDGSGMPPEVSQRVFDPFFTTKTMGRGLGLPAVLGIVRSLRGAIVVDTAPQKGSTLRVYLPAYRPLPIPLSEETPAIHSAPASSGAILVVDEDAALRPLYTELLSRLGFATVIASGTAATERAFAAEPARFNAILLDARSASGQVATTLELLRRHRRDCPCILVGDCTPAEAAATWNLSEFAAFLQKPFSLESLITALRQIPPVAK